MSQESTSILKAYLRFFGVPMVEESDSISDKPKIKCTKRRWFRFSLKSLLVLTTAICIYLTIYISQLRNQKAAISAINDLGGTFGVKVEGPKWLRNLMDDDELFYNAVRVSFGPGNDGYNPSHPFGDDELQGVILHLNNFSRFSDLDIHDSPITEVGLSDLRNLNNLESLSITNTPISEKGLGFLTQIKTLTYLDLRGCNISTDSAQKLQQSLPDCKIEL